MKRLLTSALAAAVVAAGTGSEAQAQETMNRRASLFDLGLYAGGAYSTSWFSINGAGDEDEGFKPGISPIFGATASFFFTPSFGLRLHGAYMPTNLPEAEDEFGDGNDQFIVNNYLYDLDLVFRPWIANMEASNLMASTYFFLGGGGLTSNTAGTFASNCYPIGFYVANGVCMPTESDLGTVGQGVVGLGVDLIPITSGVGVFGELAVHGYDSPAHVYNEQRAEDKIAFTPRLSLGLKFSFGNLLPPPPVVIPEPPVVQPTEPVAPVADEMRDIRVCVVENGALREVDARYNVTRGDTMVAGDRRFSEAYPATAGYAAGATWFINSDVVSFNNQNYVKFGLPRVLGVSEVTRIGDYQGVSVFAEPGAAGGNTPDIIYVPVRPGCEFQPYQKEVKVRNVRG